MKRPPINPEILRSRLAEAQGKTYWRTLDELAEDPAVREMVEREFPEHASEWDNRVSRRRFLALMGASLSLAGLVGCRAPQGPIMPYVRQPEGMILGKPLRYATSMPLGGFSTGLLVESHEGRPTKIEGLDEHPASGDSTSALHQASILGLYDPDRSQSVMYRGQPRERGDFLRMMRERLNRSVGANDVKGARIAVLSEMIGSPTLLAERERFLTAYPGVLWVQYEPINRDNVDDGTALAFGRPYHVYHKLDDADVIVSLDCDFLAQGPAHLANAWEFAERRRGGGGTKGMNRLYAFETDLSVTGANADHRLALKPSQIATFARALVAELGLPGSTLTKVDRPMGQHALHIARDLSRAGGRSAVLVGDAQPPAVHALGHAINHHLGNIGRTVLLTEPLPMSLSRCRAGIERLVSELRDGKIDTLLILGGNPAYSVPANLGFDEALRAKLNPTDRRQREAQAAAASRGEQLPWLAVHLGLYHDETARLCHWHLPEAHYLETWGDGIAYDGTVSISQPLIAPLYRGQSALEWIDALTPAAGEEGTYADRSALETIKAHWRTHRPEGVAVSFDAFWEKTLHEGVMEQTKLPTVTPALVPDLLRQPEMIAPKTSDSGIEVRVAPDPAVYDGRFANNGWLQEWPRPITRLTWGNAVLMSPETARSLGLSNTAARVGGEHGQMIADMVTLELSDRRTLTAAAWIVPGHADNAMTVYLGYGRTHAGKVGSRVGWNATLLQTTASPWLVGTARASKARGTYPMACVQAHHSMEGRDIVRSGTVSEFKRDPNFAVRRDPTVRIGVNGQRTMELPTLFNRPDGTPAHTYDGYKWGMAVDLTTCTGCGACVVACQAENNSPVVGKEQVTRGREMHWLRIDLYYQTPSAAREDFSRAQVLFQPVMCQHCEHAPCEVVCPVEATAHSDEGLNDMVYNRCVGTRYCANNCPYKVRRFNFFQYSDYETPSLRLQYNPEVTVRTRGVMEKCTFCVQRIARGRIEAATEQMDELHLPPGERQRTDHHGPEGAPRQVDGREIAYIRDGEVKTACQDACPTAAIVFGDLNDATSKVANLHRSSLRYDLLGDLGTRPRVAYLARLRNPNPALEA